jgi:hypothetical protein
MRTRPKYLDEYNILALNAEANLDYVPENFSDIDRREDKEEWHNAMNEENSTWTLTELLPGKKATGNKWVFKVKRDESGDIERYKARLAVKGFSQRKGVDYIETYALVDV